MGHKWSMCMAGVVKSHLKSVVEAFFWSLQLLSPVRVCSNLLLFWGRMGSFTYLSWSASVGFFWSFLLSYFQKSKKYRYFYWTLNCMFCSQVLHIQITLTSCLCLIYKAVPMWLLQVGLQQGCFSYSNRSYHTLLWL